MASSSLERDRRMAREKAKYANQYSTWHLYDLDEKFRKIVDILVATVRGRRKSLDLFYSACCFGKPSHERDTYRTPAYHKNGLIHTLPYILLSNAHTSLLVNLGPCSVLCGLYNEPWFKKISELKKNKEEEKLDKYYERLLKKIRKPKSMSLHAYIKKYAPDLNVKSVSSALEALSGGAEFKIASSPEEVSFVYMNGPYSCMKVADKSKLKDGMLAKGVHPASWYSHCPDTGVAYLKYKDLVVARTVIYPNKKKWVRLYSEYHNYTEMLKAELEKQGYSAMQGTYGSDMFKNDFKVPGVKVEDEWVCPAPVLDYVASKHSVSFDESTKEFNWKPCTSGRVGEEKDNGIIFTLDFTRGFISSIQTRILSCTVCNAKCSANKFNSRLGGFVHFAKDGSIFCSDQCKDKSGYIYAREADGNKVLVPASSIQAYDLFGKGSFYTTEYAKEKAGGLPLLLHPNNSLNECKLIASPQSACRIAFVAREATSDRCAIPVGVSDAIGYGVAGLDVWKLAEITEDHSGNKRYLLKQSVNGEPQVYEPGKKLTTLLQQAHRNAEKWLGCPCTLKSCVSDGIITTNFKSSVISEGIEVFAHPDQEPMYILN